MPISEGDTWGNVKIEWEGNYWVILTDEGPAVEIQRKSNGVNSSKLWASIVLMEQKQFHTLIIFIKLNAAPTGNITAMAKNNSIYTSIKYIIITNLTKNRHGNNVYKFGQFLCTS